MPPLNTAVGDGSIIPTKIDLGDVLRESWRIFKGQLWLVVGAVFIVNLIIEGYDQVLELTGPLLIQEMGLAGTFLVVTASLFGLIMNVFLTIGQTLLLLNVVTGREASLNNLLQGGPYFWRTLGATILFVLMLIVGFALLIVPSIIVALMFGQFYYLIVDKNVGVMDSLSLSRKITYGNKGTLFLMWLVLIGLGILGLLACIVGIFFTASYGAVIMAVAYRMMSGQPIAQPSEPYTE